MKKMKNSFLKRIPLQIAAFIGLFLLIECTKVIKRTFPDSHNSAHTLDWNGTYKSTVPDANYSGTVTEITLDTARKYIIKKTYLEKGVQAVKGTEENGNFSWNKAGNTITLLGIKNQPNEYFVGENRLWELDKDGNKIKGNDADKYIFNKQMSAVIMPETPKLTGNWELDYIAGSPMTFQELYPRKRPTINFDTISNLVSGSTSCNNYAGKLIVNGNKIDFTGPLAVTKMACLDDKGNGENLFLETLKKVNNYSMNPDSSLNFIMGDIAIMRFAKK
jgi:heat shock protein HslJ